MSKPGSLSEEQKRFYASNGYIVLKNLLSQEELEALSQEYDLLFRRKNQEKMESSWVGSDDDDRRNDGPTTVKGIHNLQYHHAVFGRLLYHPGLLEAAAGVMGSEDILLHHTKAHLKPPRQGAAYPMHQDYHYFPHKKNSLVAVFVHLDAAAPDNGGLFVFPGSHRGGPLEDVGAREGNFHYVDQTKYPLSNATPVICERGDIVIFSYLLVHGSSPNTSDRPRRMLLIQLMAADDEPEGQQQTRPSQGLVLRGANVNRDASISKRFDD